MMYPGGAAYRRPRPGVRFYSSHPDVDIQNTTLLPDDLYRLALCIGADLQQVNARLMAN